MISRTSTLAIAEAYCHYYTGTIRHSAYSAALFRYYSGSLYDFLFRNDFPEWLLNLLMALPTRERSLKEFILRIHTGESLVSATELWDWNQRKTLGQTILGDLAQCLIYERQNNPQFCTSSTERKVLDDMQAYLELDGHIYRNGRLWPPEQTVIQETDEQDLLETLVTALQLTDVKTIKHHLGLSVTAYLDSRWDDSIGNSRKVLESVLEQVTFRHSTALGDPLPESTLKSPVAVREYLQRVGLLSKREKQSVSEVYGLLSETGGHPYIAQRDQARLMRNLALTFTQFVLLRLDGALRSRTAPSP